MNFHQNLFVFPVLNILFPFGKQFFAQQPFEQVVQTDLTAPLPFAAVFQIGSVLPDGRDQFIDAFVIQTEVFRTGTSICLVLPGSDPRRRAISSMAASERAAGPRRFISCVDHQDFGEFQMPALAAWNVIANPGAPPPGSVRQAAISTSDCPARPFPPGQNQIRPLHASTFRWQARQPPTPRAWPPKDEYLGMLNQIAHAHAVANMAPPLKGC
jgi:hypothetical protein